MRIILLAPTQTGKTSLLVGAYAYLSSRQSSKFGLKIDASDYRLRLNEAVRGLVTSRGKDRFQHITATSAVDHYDGSLEWKQALAGGTASSSSLPSFSLTLVDVPGGAFSNIDARVEAGSVAATMAADVRGALISADAFVVVAPFDLVYQRNNKSYFADINLGLREIKAAIYAEYDRRKSKVSKSRPMPVVIALTRADRLDGLIKPSEQKSEMLEVLRAHAKHFITTSFADLMQREDLQFYLVATSLGPGIEESGDFEPLNVDLPLLFCCWHGLLQRAEWLAEQRAANLKASDQHRTEAGGKRKLAQSAEQESSGLMAASRAAAAKKFKDFFTSRSTTLMNQAAGATGRAARLREEAVAFDAKVVEAQQAAEQNMRERATTFLMARDVVASVRRSLADGCYLIQGGHFMVSTESSSGEPHQLPLRPGTPIDQLDVVLEKRA